MNLVFFNQIWLIYLTFQTRFSTNIEMKMCQTL